MSLTDSLDYARLLEALSPAMREAGHLIEQLKAAGCEARDKADKTVVTEADEAAERLLEAAIRSADPDSVIVGEEASAAGIQPDTCARFWLIDPLDGTRDFVEGGADYSVNIGLIEDGEPVLGLVLHPPSQTLWTGARGLGAWKEIESGARDAIATRPLAHPPVIVTSRSHLDAKTKAWVDATPGAVVRPSGSSLKFCLLAEGAADAYPRYGNTSEWDTAAAHAILLAAGGSMVDSAAQPFRYGKPKYLNGSFLALGDPAATARLPVFAAV